MLGAWAIPEGLVASAPASPYFFDPAVFTAAADEAVARKDDTPSDRLARDALPSGGTVLDVGVGAGAASLRLGADRIVGVDPNLELLEAFAERADRLSSAPTEILGTWPDVADETPVADVAVCHHVVYNVADVAGFAVALTEHATRRVVIELTALHPMSWLAPYWTAMHGITQPVRPVAEDAVAVLEELGLAAQHELWTRPIQMIGEAGGDRLERIARRLCLSSDRHEELRRVLDATPPPAARDVVTLWWPAT